MANTLFNSGGAAAALVFESTEFDVIDQLGQPWLRGPQIGDALGYAKAGRISIHKLYESNKAEFADNMTALVKLPTAGGEQETRIFSLRGAHLLAMFARTAIAALFRKWVLDILDAQVQQFALPTTTTITPAQAQHLRELVQLVVESGKQNHGETWSRLHRKLHVNSYLALRPDQFDAACRYLGGKFDDTSIAMLIQKHLPHAVVAAVAMERAPKALLAPRAQAIDVQTLCQLILGGVFTGMDFINLAYAVNQHQFLNTSNNLNRGIGEEVASKIRGMSDADLHIINTKASVEVWRRSEVPFKPTH